MLLFKKRKSLECGLDVAFFLLEAEFACTAMILRLPCGGHTGLWSWLVKGNGREILGAESG